jgi:hypothetical protein
MRKRSKIQQRAPSGVKESQRLRAALGAAQRRIRVLGGEREAARREIAALRRVVAEHAEQLEALTARIKLVSSREEELRAMLLGAHDQLMRSAEKIKTDLATELQRSVSQQDATSDLHSVSEGPAAAPLAEQYFASKVLTSPQQRGEYLDYPRLVGHIREVAKAVLPPDATVVVVSKGDEELLKLGGERRGWHFPQNEEGVYAGYYPADSTEAIVHLEELRAKGADFLLFPETAFWWLERYEAFKQHLDDSHYRRIWSEGCIIYQLHKSRPDNAEAQ